MSNAVNAPDSDRSNNVDDRSVTHPDPVVADDTTTLDRREVVGRQKDAFGGGIILVAIIFVSYLAGGYVAGRMARFNGFKQGLGVWLWAVIMAILVAIAGWLADARFDVLAQLNSFPRIPLNEGTLTTAGVIAAVCVVAASLIGALLGGLTGMRYHRRVDRAGLGR